MTRRNHESRGVEILLKMAHLLMGGDLKDRIGRGIHYRLTTLKVLLAQLVQYHGARGRVVAQGAPAYGRLVICNELPRKPSIGEGG